MLPMFKGEKQLEQKNEIEKRLKLLREIQGAEIDKIKGTTPPNFPKSWKHWVPINKDDDDITKAEKYKYNSMVVKKKPYFFVYLYSSLYDSYKNYEKNFNSISMTHFGLPIKDLLRKSVHNENELMLIRKYRKYSPVLETECVMNILCKEIENVEFDALSYPEGVFVSVNVYLPAGNPSITCGVVPETHWSTTLPLESLTTIVAPGSSFFVVISILLIVVFVVDKLKFNLLENEFDSS